MAMIDKKGIVAAIVRSPHANAFLVGSCDNLAY
jgi:hypothetical protein